MAANDTYAGDGLRVLGVAMRILPDSLAEYTPEAIECQLTFLGLIAMQDPPRPEVQSAVQRSHRAGIALVRHDRSHRRHGGLFLLELCSSQIDAAHFQPTEMGFVAPAEGFSPAGSGVQHVVDHYNFFLNWLHGCPGVPLAADGNAYRLATTMTLAAIVAIQIGSVFGCRTERASTFTIGLFTNRLVLVGVASELIILGLLIYTPLLQEPFNTAPIGPREWAFVFAWTPIIFFAAEARKALLRWRERRAIRR